MDAPIAALAAFGPWGVIVFTVLAVLKGWLVPRTVLDDIRTELHYTRRRNHELEAQRNLAWAEAARLGVALAELPLPSKEGQSEDPAVAQS